MHVGGGGRDPLRGVLHHVQIEAPHPFTRAVVRAVGSRAAAHRAFTDLLDRRLRALARVAAGERVTAEELGLGGADRRTARRFLRPREASWHDGDENRVRALLDRPPRAGEDPRRAAARAVLDAAHELGGAARPETLWFLLWAMEPLLAAISAADVCD